MKPTEQIKSADEAAEFAERHLILSVSDAKHPFRYPVLSTVTDKKPESRILVLRRVTSPGLTLLMYSDLRTGKVRALERNPEASVLFWHPKLSMQLRAACKASIVRAGDLWEQTWENMSEERQAEYNTKHPPGTAIGSLHAQPEMREARTRESFALIRLEVYAAEALMLRRSGHLRASWTYKDGKRSSALCLVP